MASKIPGGQGEVKLNFKGMGELLKSNEIRAELVGRMARVQSALPGSKLEAVNGRTRVRVKVGRGTDFEEANTGDLSRALDLADADRGTQVKTRKPKRGA
jgi:putative component of toxin-antitoxin plasmid stabilization module